MGSKNKKKTLHNLYVTLILSAMFELCFSSLQLGKKMNITIPDRMIFLPVQGDVYPNGVFRTIVQIGNPPSPYYVDIDTGSGITWVQCYAGSGAKLYKGPHPPYIPTPNTEIIRCKDPLCPNGDLSIDPNDQCDYMIEYADQSVCSGVMLKESFTFKLGNGEDFQSTLAFGCGYDQSDIKGPHYVDGVLGLAVNGGLSIVGQLSNMGFKNAHGHCFSRMGGGFAFIGDSDISSETVWTAMLPNQEDHYEVGPADVIFGSDVIAKGEQVAFDSGSTYTYLNEDTYQAALSAVNGGLYGKNLNIVNDENLPVCWRAGDSDFRSIDEAVKYFTNLLVLNFSNDNIQFVIPPESYLIVTDHGNACFGILNGKEAKLGDMNLIGSNAFQDKLLIYDNEQSRIGWSPSDCV